jgi:hypothetical protein
MASTSPISTPAWRRSACGRERFLGSSIKPRQKKTGPLRARLQFLPACADNHLPEGNSWLQTNRHRGGTATGCLQRSFNMRCVADANNAESRMSAMRVLRRARNAELICITEHCRVSEFPRLWFRGRKRGEYFAREIPLLRLRDLHRASRLRDRMSRQGRQKFHCCAFATRKSRNTMMRVTDLSSSG